MLNGVGIASFGTTVTRLLMLQNNAELRIRNAKKMKEEWQKVKLGEICDCNLK